MTTPGGFCSVNNENGLYNINNSYSTANNNNSNSQERFFQYILVSQLETVEAVSLLDKQVRLIKTTP